MHNQHLWRYGDAAMEKFEAIETVAVIACSLRLFLPFLVVLVSRHFMFFDHGN